MLTFERKSRTVPAIALALAACVAAVYFPVHAFGFVGFDDGEYVVNNAWVRSGLSWDGLVTAFAGFHVFNWHPLTWLSHMADVQLFGVDPGPHHVVNVVFHAANTALLFLLLLELTGAAWRSALVAALFALHPLHVESVAWISERKDLLSALCWLLATFAYVRYVRRPGALRYALLMAAFALGLLSKPMVVTLPAVLLLLDGWPLRRWNPDDPLRSAAALVREKLPLFALSAASAAVTYLAQARGGSVSAVSSAVHLPLRVRLGNAVHSYAAYLVDTVWPTELAVFYPHPGLLPQGLSAWRVALAAVALAAITGGVLRARKRRPELLVGWCWYLVTLTPVIGVVQVGGQARADRYTYLPLVGVFLCVAWAVDDSLTRGRARRIGIAAGIGLLLVALSVQARRQVETWRDDLTLWAHAAAVTEGNAIAWQNLGAAQFGAARYGEAVLAYREAVRLQPQAPKNWMNLGIGYTSVGETAAADECFDTALRMTGDDPEIWFNVGAAAALTGRFDRAADAAARLRRLHPPTAERLEKLVSSQLRR